MEADTLVIYYSLERFTEAVAEAITEELSADSLRLSPRNEVRPRWLERYFLEFYQGALRRKPKLATLEVAPASYERLVIGTPVYWFGDMAPVVRSFLTTYELGSREVGLFCTYGSEPGDALKAMAAYLQRCRVVGKKTFKRNAPGNLGTGGRVRDWARFLF